MTQTTRYLLALCIYSCCVRFTLGAVGRDLGRWTNCTWDATNDTNAFPTAFGCSKIVAPINQYGLNIKQGSNPDKYIIIYDNFPLSQNNLCLWEPLASYGFKMEQTCMQYFCSANSTNTDHSWLYNYAATVGYHVNLDKEGTYDLLHAMIQNYCFYCKDRPPNDDFKAFHQAIRNNGTCSFTWTTPDPKCGSFDTGVPYAFGLQRRVQLASPTACFCHKYNRFRFTCDSMHGAVTFVYEVISFLGFAYSIFTMPFVLLLVIIPIHVRKIIAVHKGAKVGFKEAITELADLRYAACCYLTCTIPTMITSDIFTLNFVGILSSRGVYLHELDLTFGLVTALLALTAHGLALSNWVNVLHYASTMQYKVPIWRIVLTSIFAVVLTGSALFVLLGASIPERYSDLARGSTIFGYVIIIAAVVTYGIGFMIYGFRLLNMLTKSNDNIKPLNFRFVRFNIMLAVFVVITVIMIPLALASLFGDSSVFYGLGLVQVLLPFNIRVYIQLLAYLLFNRKYLPEFLHEKTTVPVEVREEKPATPTLETPTG